MAPLVYGLLGASVGLSVGSVIGVTHTAALNDENPFGSVAGGLLGAGVGVGLATALGILLPSSGLASIPVVLFPVFPYFGSLLFSGPRFLEDPSHPSHPRPDGLQSKAWIPAVGAGALAATGGILLYRADVAHRELAAGTTYLGAAGGQALAAQGAREQVLGQAGVALAGAALTATLYMLVAPPSRGAP